jgi:hypothetical protein
MRQMAIGICAGLVAAVALFASFNTDALKPSLAQAQTATTKPADCSSTSSQQMITQVVAAAPGKVLGFFVCVADLDGAGRQAIVVGRYAETGGTLSIITNTGAVRKQVNW